MISEYGGTDSDGYKQLQEQMQANAKLEKNIALEKERLRILSGKDNSNIHFLCPFSLNNKSRRYVHTFDVLGENLNIYHRGLRKSLYLI